MSFLFTLLRHVFFFHLKIFPRTYSRSLKTTCPETSCSLAPTDRSLTATASSSSVCVNVSGAFTSLDLGAPFLNSFTPPQRFHVIGPLHLSQQPSQQSENRCLEQHAADVARPSERKDFRPDGSSRHHGL